MRYMPLTMIMSLALLGTIPVAAAEKERALVFSGTNSAQHNTIQQPSQQQPQRWQHHALLIGCSDYQYSTDLPGVREDIEVLAPTLVEHGFTVRTLLDPGKDELQSALDRFFAKEGQNKQSRLLVWFSGHGVTVPGVNGAEVGYLVPVDSPSLNPGNADDVAAFKHANYAIENLTVLSDVAVADHVAVFFDSCFSGSIFRKQTRSMQRQQRTLQQPSRLFISSGSANETVPDYSYFRRSFISAINGDGDANRDGLITGHELFGYLSQQLTRSQQTSQTPQQAYLQQPGDFFFYAPTHPQRPSIGSLQNLDTSEHALHAGLPADWDLVVEHFAKGERWTITAQAQSSNHSADEASAMREIQQQLRRDLHRFVDTRLQSAALSNDGVNLAYKTDYGNNKQRRDAVLKQIATLQARNVRWSANDRSLQATYQIAIPLPKLRARQ